MIVSNCYRCFSLQRSPRGSCQKLGRMCQGWGQWGTAPRPATRRRRAHFHHGGTPPPAPGRLKRPGKKGGLGGPRHLAAAGPPSPSVTASWQQGSLTPGAEGASPCRSARRGLFPGGGGGGHLRVYRQTLIAGLRAAARKPTNLAKINLVRQEPNESPAAFLERIMEAFRQYTPMDPQADES